MVITRRGLGLGWEWEWIGTGSGSETWYRHGTGLRLGIR